MRGSWVDNHSWRNDIESIDEAVDFPREWAAREAIARRIVAEDGGGTTIEDEIQFLSECDVWAISKDSELYDDLLAWYGTHDAVLDGVRSAVEDEDHLYFYSGGNYHVLDMDLLGGVGDGAAETEFEEYIAKRHRATRGARL